MNYGIANKNALVTGGARGIGRAIVQALALEGANVAVCDISASAANESASAAGRGGVEAIACVVDVTDAAAVHGMISDVKRRLGPIDILVNNAGVRYSANDMPVGFQALWETSQAQWDAELALILHGTLNTMNNVMPSMRERKHGRIVNIGSPAGRLGMVGMAAYGAAKASVISLTRHAAMELAPYKVTANCVIPGFIASHSVSVLQGKKTDFFGETEKQWLNIPLGGPGKPEAVANMVTFLASEAADWITGTDDQRRRWPANVLRITLAGQPRSPPSSKNATAQDSLAILNDMAPFYYRFEPTFLLTHCGINAIGA